MVGWETVRFASTLNSLPIQRQHDYYYLFGRHWMRNLVSSLVDLMCLDNKPIFIILDFYFLDFFTDIMTRQYPNRISLTLFWVHVSAWNTRTHTLSLWKPVQWISIFTTFGESDWAPLGVEDVILLLNLEKTFGYQRNRKYITKRDLGCF